MEQFHDGQHVWLRNRARGTYLHADDDGERVSLHRHRTSLNAAWSVHIYHGDGLYLLLHNAAYGRYLAATTTPAPLGHRGFRVAQRNYDQEEEEAIMWQAIPAGSENDILLHNVRRPYRYLRANGRYLIWNNGVTVDELENVSTMRHWIVEPIPARLTMPALPGPVRVMLRRAVAPWQLIRFVQAVLHRGGLVRFPFQGGVRVPSEERAGQPRRGHRRPLRPHHVRPIGPLWEADPTRRRPAPRTLLRYHRDRRHHWRHTSRQ